MGIKVPKYRKVLIFRFTCSHCGTVGEFNPETKTKTNMPGAGDWTFLPNILIISRGGLEIKLRGIVCMRCGILNYRYHEGTPAGVAGKNLGMKLRPDTIQEVEYEEITEAEMQRRCGYPKGEVQREERGEERTAGSGPAGRGKGNDDSVGSEGRATVGEVGGNVPDESRNAGRRTRGRKRAV